MAAIPPTMMRIEIVNQIFFRPTKSNWVSPL